MKLAEGIAKHGFRNWYERELLQSHAHLVLTLLCAIACLPLSKRQRDFAAGWTQLTDLVAIALCAGTGLWALRRYLFLLTHAEAVAHQADCGSCGSYGRLQLVGSADGDGNEQRVHVRCRRCSHEWCIDA